MERVLWIGFWMMAYFGRAGVDGESDMDRVWEGGRLW